MRLYKFKSVLTGDVLEEEDSSLREEGGGPLLTYYSMKNEVNGDDNQRDLQ